MFEPLCIHGKGMTEGCSECEAKWQDNMRSLASLMVDMSNSVRIGPKRAGDDLRPQPVRKVYKH